MVISNTLGVGLCPGSYESYPSNNSATILVSLWFEDGSLWSYLFNVQESTELL